MGSSPSKLNEFAAPIFDPKTKSYDLDWDDEKGTNPETIEGVLSNAEHKVADVKIAQNVVWYISQICSDSDLKKKTQIHKSKRVYNILIKNCLKHCSAAAVKELKPQIAADVRPIGQCADAIGVAIRNVVADLTDSDKDIQKIYGTSDTVSAIQHVLENTFKEALEDGSIAELLHAVLSIVENNDHNKSLFATSGFASAVGNALKNYCDGGGSLFWSVRAVSKICEGNAKRSAVFCTNKDFIEGLVANFEKVSRNQMHAASVAIGIHKMMTANSMETNVKMIDGTKFEDSFEKLGDALSGDDKEPYDAVRTLIYKVITSGIMKS